MLASTILLIAASGAVTLGQAPSKTAGERCCNDRLDPGPRPGSTRRTIMTARRPTGFFAHDFVEIHPGGILVNKQQQVDMIKDTKLGDIAIQSTDIQVRYASPDVAVLTDTTTIRGMQGEKQLQRAVPSDAQRVFAKFEGRWHAAGAGLARLAAQ